LLQDGDAAVVCCTQRQIHFLVGRKSLTSMMSPLDWSTWAYKVQLLEALLQQKALAEFRVQ
jgi:hypothetical protein